MSSDALEAQERMTKAMADMVNEIDKSHLRRMQKDMHKCAINCLNNEERSLEGTHKCIETCSMPIQRAQEYVQREMGGFQERLQRCILNCEDLAKDKMGPNPSEVDVEKIRGHFEKCAVGCVNDHLNLIPSFVDRIKKSLDNDKN